MGRPNYDSSQHKQEANNRAEINRPADERLRTPIQWQLLRTATNRCRRFWRFVGRFARCATVEIRNHEAEGLPDTVTPPEGILFVEPAVDFFVVAAQFAAAATHGFFCIFRGGHYRSNVRPYTYGCHATSDQRTNKELLDFTFFDSVVEHYYYKAAVHDEGIINDLEVIVGENER